jgi:hypothetical protein
MGFQKGNRESSQMTYLLVTSILLLAAFSLSYLIRSSLLISLPTAIFGITAVLYLFGLLNQLLVGFWIVLGVVSIATIASTVLLIRNKELVPHLKSLLTPGLAIFMSLALFSYLMTRGMQLSSWDEFSHWGTVVRATFLYDAIGPYNPADLMFRNYPPSLSLFEYFVTKLGVDWLEGNIFWAYQLMIWSLFTPFLAQLTWVRWRQVILVAPLMLIAPLAFFNSLSMTLIDPILGMLSGYALAIAYVGNVSQWRLVLHLGLAIFMLTLAKDAGAFMACMVVALYLIRLLTAKNASREEWTWKRFAILGSFPILSLIASNQSWAALIRERVVSPAFSEEIDLAALFGAFSGEGPDYWQQVISTFGFGLTNYPINPDGVVAIPQLQLLLLFASALVALEWMVSRRMGRKLGLALIGIAVSGAGVYTFGLLALYLFRFGEWEAVRLASYERYLGTYWSGISLFIALVTIWLVTGSGSPETGMSPKSRHLGLTESVTATVVILALLSLSPVQKLSQFVANPHGYSSQVRAQFDPVLEKARRAGVKRGDKVWIIAQHTSGFEYWVLRYSLIGTDVNPYGWSVGTPASDDDIWTLEKTPSDWRQSLTNYDFVLIYRLTESFAEEFGSLFAESPDLGSSQVFRVSGVGQELELTEVR